MNKYSHNPELLQQAEELAKVPGTTLLDISKVLEINFIEVFEACKDSKSDLYKAITRGQLLSEIELKEKIKKLSDSGSGPAQTLQVKLLTEAKVINLYNYYEQQEKSL